MQRVQAASRQGRVLEGIGREGLADSKRLGGEEEGQEQEQGQEALERVLYWPSQGIRARGLLRTALCHVIRWSRIFVLETTHDDSNMVLMSFLRAFEIDG